MTNEKDKQKLPMLLALAITIILSLLLASCATAKPIPESPIVLYPDLSFPDKPIVGDRIVFDESTGKALVDLSFLDDVARYEVSVETQKKIYEAWKRAHNIK